MNIDFNFYKNIWIENTETNHEHGGYEWELGTCLWSPTKNRSGADSYSLMREPKPGDLVIHFVKADDIVGKDRGKRYLCGFSYVEKSYITTSNEPPIADKWSGFKEYYKIPLKNFKKFSNTIFIEELLETYKNEIIIEIKNNDPKKYPFHFSDKLGLKLNQGMYISKCASNLYNSILKTIIINDANLFQ